MQFVLYAQLRLCYMILFVVWFFGKFGIRSGLILMVWFPSEINSVRYLEMKFHIFGNLDIQNNSGSVTKFPNTHPYSQRVTNSNSN